MDTYRFGRKLKLPSTFAIKHQLRKLMAEDEIKKAKETAATYIGDKGVKPIPIR